MCESCVWRGSFGAGEELESGERLQVADAAVYKSGEGGLLGGELGLISGWE